MSQSDLTIENQSRSSARADINAALAALGTFQKGPNAPTGAQAGWLWLDDDTPSSTVWTLKRYDGTDWIPVTVIDTVANTETPVGSVSPAAARGQIAGFVWANNLSDPAHDLDIAAGTGVDTTGAAVIQGGAMTKRYDASWTAGNGNGGRRGSAANGDWWIHAVLDVTNRLVDYILDQSRTSPSLPSGYTLFLPIGWFQVSGGNVVATHVYEVSGGGVEVERDARSTDATVSVGTSQVLQALACVPAGISVSVDLDMEAGPSGAAIDVRCPNQAATPAIGSGLGVAGASISLTSGAQSVNGVTLKSQIRTRTDTSQQVALQADAAGQTVRLAVRSFGWSRR